MNVPSFSSFPPSFGSFPDTEEIDKKVGSSKSQQKDDSDSRRGRYRDKRKDRSESESKARREKSKERRHRHDQYDDERGKHEEDYHVRLGRNYEGGAPGLFIVDKSGDPLNVVYGGLNATDVPKYRRAGYGQILGLPRSLKIISRSTGGKLLEVGRNGKRPPARYIESRSLALLTTRTRQLLPLPTGKGKARPQPAIEGDRVPDPDFIRVPRSRRSDTDPLSTYRSINTSKPEASDSDSVVSSVSDAIGDSSESDIEDNVPRTAHQHSLAILEASLQKNPTSLPLWFSLVELTLSILPPSAKTSLVRARADIKLSVLDRAMQTDKRNKASVELRVKWLNAGADIWDGEKLEKEWEQAVRELGMKDNDNLEQGFTRNDMWDEWLRWRISSAGRGTRGQTNVEGIIEDTKWMLKNVDGELMMVKVLWRIATVLQDAGFSERAMALFQAQIELTFNCPSSLALRPFPERLQSLEEFWEAEIPRVGELDAHGWQMWVGQGKPDIRPSAPALQYPASNVDIDKSSDPYIRWAIDEVNQDAASCMPKCTNDASDDPYTTILFSDIKGLLLDIRSADAKHALRLAWLEYIGLHIPGFVKCLGQDTNMHDDVWAHRHLSRAPYLEGLFPPNTVTVKLRDWDAIAGTIIAREKTYGPTFGVVKEWGRGVFEPLEYIGKTTSLWDERDIQAVDPCIIRRIFQQLRRCANCLQHDEEWDMMAIAFEAAQSIKSAIKLSRTILSDSRESLPLWGIHARLETMRGKIEEARRVYETALSSTSGTPKLRRGEALLWWAWAEMEWIQGDDDRARTVALLAAGVTIGGPMAVLRGMRALEERVRSSSEWKEREAWVCLLALIEVLAGGAEAIEEGMRVLQGYVNNEGLTGVQRESAWTRMLLLGWKHTVLLRRQAKRSVVHNNVTSVVREIEQAGCTNTVILGVFLESQKGESIWGRVRALVGNPALLSSEENGLTFKTPERGVSRRIWEVWLANWELGRWENEKERVRNSLGIAVGDERTRASPIIWQIYVAFEIYCGELKRAKRLLFRAVAECPLVKELYLVAFRALRSVFTTNELEAWAETMAERGIRMHRGLEEYIGTNKGSGSSNSDDGISSDDGTELELEKEARDYRHLAPF